MKHTIERIYWTTRYLSETRCITKRTHLTRINEDVIYKTNKNLMKKIKTRVQCLRYNRRLAQVLRRECEKYGRNPRMPRDSYGNSGFRVQTMHNWTRYAEDNDISFLDPGSVGERVLWKNFSSMHSHVGYVATPSIFSTEGRARVGMQVSGFERFVP